MEPLPVSAADEKNVRILIVDDSPDSRALLISVLRLGGFKETLTAESAAEACQYFMADAEGRIQSRADLILLDINMPEMDGIEACRQFKTMDGLQDLPVIIVTGSADADSLPLAFDAGAMDYIQKPINKMELLARVRSAAILKREMDRRKAREQELEQALSEIKILRGILPICASCKKIRDDKGYWTQIETYIGKHSDAVFSHGVCPKCLKEHYPELYPELLAKNPDLFKLQSDTPPPSSSD